VRIPDPVTLSSGAQKFKISVLQFLVEAAIEHDELFWFAVEPPAMELAGSLVCNSVKTFDI
jgi:hypothetical protein